MRRHVLSAVILAVMVLAAVVPALMAPSQAEAMPIRGTWMVYTPNHPSGCAPMPWDCYVIYVDG